MRSISSGAALGQHLDGDVVGDRALLDDLADEVEIRLAGRREADLDLLVAHADQQVEHAALRARLIGSIRGLVAVARRSTAHHSGARSMILSGQVRSGSATDSTSSTKGR